MPVTPAQIDAAVPPAGTPNRGLTNTALKGLIDDIAAVGVGIGVGTVNTFADLPAPATVSGQRWWVLTSTGVWLVNRRNKGAYYSDGAAWSYLGDFPVTAVEVGNVPAGGIAAGDVQAAINELDTDKANVGAVTASGLTIATARLLGRSTAGTGGIEEITLGTNLSFTGTTLNAAGGSGSPGGSNTQVQFNSSGAFAGASKTAIEAGGNLLMSSNTTLPATPATDTVAFYARRYAGSDFLEYLRPSGRNITLQAHLGLNRASSWGPGSGTSVDVFNSARTGVGTVSHPAISSSSLIASTRRWRVSSAATANSSCDERVGVHTMWRGNAAGLGGFTSITRFALITLQTGSVGFWGILGSNAALATTATIASLTDCVGIGFTQGTNANFQLIHNDNTGAPTLTDLGASFPASTANPNFYTLIIRSVPNGSDIFVTVIEERTGTEQNYTISTDMPSNTTFLAPRNYLNNGGVAAAVSYDCVSVYVETDY